MNDVFGIFDSIFGTTPNLYKGDIKCPYCLKVTPVPGGELTMRCPRCTKLCIVIPRASDSRRPDPRIVSLN